MGMGDARVLSKPAGIVPWIWIAGLLALLLWGYTRSNNFPFYYHTDEPGKVEQVISGQPNYRHPLLMINATNALVRLLNVPRNPQRIVIVGRWGSALAAIAAIIASILIARRQSNWMLGVFAGALAGFHPFLFEATHYLKEDCYLLAGLAWTWYAVDRFCERQSAGWLWFSGITSGIAISGKYLGILALGFAIGVVVYQSRRAGWSIALYRCVLLVSACVVTAGLLNFQTMLHPVDAMNGLGRELNRIDRDRTSALFSKNYFFLLIERAGLPLVLSGLAYLAIILRRREKTRLIEVALLIFAFAYLLVLCLTPLGKARYLIPVVTLFSIFAVWAMRSITVSIHERHSAFPQSAAALAGCCLLVAAELPFTFLGEHEFSHDQRTKMVEWIRANLPVSAVIAHESRIWPSRDPGDWRTQLPQRRLSPPYFSITLGNIENMKRLGITHVVAAGAEYRRTVGEDHVSVGATSSFYQELKEKGRVVWQVPPGRILYLTPGLTIYALPDENQ